MLDPETLSLTLAQQFQMRIVEESLAKITHEEALELLHQAAKLLMIKDNVIRDLMRRGGL